jgi:DNA-binding beta-propeller fold protein YncE
MTSRFGCQGSANLSTFFRNLAVLAFVVTLGTASASADVAVEVFTFTGECTDCSGTGTGTLILLAGYDLGTALSADDLYSFNYSSNLTDISIHNDPTEVLSGTLPVGLGPANIFISGDSGTVTFSSSSDGTWSALNPPADYGTSGIWTAGYPTPTPEPSALPVIGIALAGAVFLRRRRVQAA